MGIQDWSENVISVDLRAEPDTRNQIEEVIHRVRDKGNCGVVMDFTNVTILTSTSLAALLRLRKLLADCGHRLLLCSVGSATKGVISVTGLDGVFEIVDDRFDALAKVEAMPDSPVASADEAR
jgi:anti-anti-sigma factor